MRLDEETIRAAMNRRLSALDADPRRRARIRERIQQEEEPRMNKKLSLGLILALILTLLTVTALAATLIFSPHLSAAIIADRALEERYGITPAMQTYFVRTEKELPEGGVAVYYTGLEHLSGPLGQYTVVIRDGKAQSVSWNLDGQSTDGGFEAEAWGIDQLKEMLRLNERDGSMAAFDVWVTERNWDKINEERGVTLEPTLSPEELERFSWDEDAWDRMTAEIGAKRKLSFVEMSDLAREAVVQAYGLSDSQAAMLLLDELAAEEEDAQYYPQHGQPCYVVRFFLVQHPDPVFRDVRLEWVEKDGTYTVYVNVETGVIEEIFYDSGLGGNG